MIEDVRQRLGYSFGIGGRGWVSGLSSCGRGIVTVVLSTGRRVRRRVKRIGSGGRSVLYLYLDLLIPSQNA